MVELLTVLSIIGILASLLIVALASGHAKSKQTACLSNLHQIGLGFTGFALDHEGKYPMDLAARLGGSLDFNTDRVITNTRFSRAFQHFQSLSNDAPNAKIMTCPADRYHKRAEAYPTFGNTNLSYWANPLAVPHATLEVLAGDWNLAAVRGQESNSLVLKFGREVHPYLGSVLFADGRVEITRSLAYADAPVAGASTNRPAPVRLPPTIVNPTRPALPTTPAVPGPSPAVPSGNAEAAQTIIPVADLFKPAPVADSSNVIKTSYLFKFKTAWQRSLRGQGGGGSADESRALASHKPPATLAAESPASIAKSEGAAEEPRFYEGAAAASYLFSLLLALIALLFIYLRSRMKKRNPPKVDT